MTWLHQRKWSKYNIVVTTSRYTPIDCHLWWHVSSCYHNCSAMGKVSLMDVPTLVRLISPDCYQCCFLRLVGLFLKPAKITTKAGNPIVAVATSFLFVQVGCKLQTHAHMCCLVACKRLTTPVSAGVTHWKSEQNRGACVGLLSSLLRVHESGVRRLGHGIAVQFQVRVASFSRHVELPCWPPRVSQTHFQSFPLANGCVGFDRMYCHVLPDRRHLRGSRNHDSADSHHCAALSRHARVLGKHIAGGALAAVACLSDKPNSLLLSSGFDLSSSS